MVTVIAEDSFGATASIPVTIMVTPVDEMPVITVGASTNRAPMFPSSTATRSIVEGTAAGQAIGGAPVEASDPDSDTLTYTLEGTDAGSFNINPGTGQLLTKDPLDRDTRSTYMVTIRARDPRGLFDTIDVTISVTGEGTAGDPLVTRYDTDGNEMIDKSEVLAAIDDFLFGQPGDIGKEDVLRLIDLFLFG